MAYRIFHCGKSIENYYLCIEKKVVGFTERRASVGDIVYLAVRIGKETLCGARGNLSLITDYKPWEDAERYVQCFTLDNIEFCKPFDLKILSKVGGEHWTLKYLQRSKAISDEKVLKLLDKSFKANKVDHIYRFSEYIPGPVGEIAMDEETEQEIMEDAQDDNIKIMGTFQSINFLNETDKIRGLEMLVNQNFHHLFPAYPEERTLLIDDNRMFLTSGLESDDSIIGIRGIPDALLIIYNKDYKHKPPLQINLIEYECYGEKRVRSVDKFNYLNGHIIPQLMRFASTFSIVTDKQIRESTANLWTGKIIDYILQDTNTQEKVASWIREIEPSAPEQKIALLIQQQLINAFRTNLRILLIIDELSAEQRETIKNVINSFKLENGDGIEFISYIVRLEQKINLSDISVEYALSVQY